MYKVPPKCFHSSWEGRKEGVNPSFLPYPELVRTLSQAWCWRRWGQKGEGRKVAFQACSSGPSPTLFPKNVELSFSFSGRG